MHTYDIVQVKGVLFTARQRWSCEHFNAKQVEFLLTGLQYIML